MSGLTEAEEERLRRALGVIAGEAAVGSVDGAGSGSVGSGSTDVVGSGSVDGALGVGARSGVGATGGAYPSPSVRRLRRGLAVTVSAAAVVAFGFLAHGAISGAGTDRTAKGGGDQGSDGKGLTLVEQAACTKRLLEGTVAEVRQVPHPPDAFPWVEVTLTEVRWHVPPSTETRVTVRVPDPVEWNAEKEFARGERLLVEDLGRGDVTYYRSVPGNPSLDLETVRGERLGAMRRAQEEGVECPSFWVNR